MAYKVSQLLFVLLLGGQVAISRAAPQSPAVTPAAENPLRQVLAFAPPETPSQTATPQIEQPAVASLPPVPANRLAAGAGEPSPQPAQPAAEIAAPPKAPLAEAVPPPESSLEGASKLSQEMLDVRIKAAQDDTKLDEATKKDLLKRYKATEEWLRNAEEAAARTAQYQADVQNAPQSLAAAKAKLSQPAAEPKSVVPKEASLSQVEQRASEADAESEAARVALEKMEEKIKRRGDRKAEIARVLEETKQRLEEAEKLLAGPPVADENELIAEARRIELEGRTRALRRQLELYKVESARIEAEAELLPANRELAKREKATAEKLAAFWRNVVTDYRKRETEQQAREARRQVQNAHPALRELAEKNAALAEQRKSLVESITANSQHLKSVNKKIEKLEEQFSKAEERVRKAGHSTTVGLMLRRQREELPTQRETQQRMRDIEKEMPRANLALIEIEEDRDTLGDIESVVAQTLVNLRNTVPGNNADLLEQALRELLNSKADLLDSLAADYKVYLTDLSELELSNNKLSKQITKSSNYIGEHVLWIRSTGPLWADDLTKAARGALEIAAPEPWVALAKHCGLDMLQRPLIAFGVFAVVVLIVLFHTRMRAKIASLCATKTGSLGLRFRPTLVAVAIAAVVATEWPLLLAYLGWQMSSADTSQPLTLALGGALIYAAVLLWISDFVMQMLRSEGIAESHFGWSPFSTQLLRRELRWLTILGVPLAIVVVCGETYQDAQWSSSLGRFAFVGAMLVLANFMHSILNSKENVLREAILQDSSNWFARLRSVSYLLGIGVPCVLAILAVAGYYYSAQQVAVRWQATLGISLSLMLGYSIAARWCLVRRRNLAMQQARERQRQAAEAAEAASESQPSATAAPFEDQQLDLSAIHEQLRYLLRHAVTLAMVVAAWFVWSDFLPALRVLDGVVLWEKTVQVVETHEGIDGSVERRTEDRPVQTTLRHALFAALLFVATFVLGHYLPALLEVTVLQRLPFDAGGRHAISVLFKYSLALTGVFLAFRTLSISWSSLQWLAAGMTVGLGFGLQEIFANFVSGLILLFERPIRVGDVITLGDITGKVTNMRIRATTVTNWDRKELIVPNKDLVTGRLLNWTLTDTTNRIVITVGVAYRSDPERSRQLILDAVTSHPNILPDPAPNVTFEQFADSALSFVVRAFISSMDNRLSTIHELHVKIHKTLKDHGIEIAFPQRDIHIHGLERLSLGRGDAERREAA